MKFALMLPPAIEADWERIGGLLSPAIARDDQRQDSDVFRDLMSGDMALFDIDLPNARGVAVIEFAPSQTAEKCLWLLYIAGRIGGKRRVWIERVRVLMGYFAGIGRAYDCTEIRIEGRNWGHVFPDWERLAERPGRNELRKAL